MHCFSLIGSLCISISILYTIQSAQIFVNHLM